MTITPNLGANGYLDPSCKGVTVPQKDMIGKHGFHVSASGPKGSQFQVVDPVIVAANPGSSKGTRIGDDLDSLLKRAGEERKAFLAGPAKPKAAAAKPATAPKPAAAASDTGTEKPAATGKAAKKKPAAELKAGSLDNTGKREKPAKKEKAPKKDNRYIRSARAIMADPAITPEKLAKLCGVCKPGAQSLIMAGEAWKQALLDNGWKAPKADKAPKAEAPASGK